MKEKIKVFFLMWWTFFKIGLFTFGGGYAMLPMFEKELVEKHGWTDHEELLDVYALSQCTPGVIAVNTSTFIGKKIGGFSGAAGATIGVVTPSLIIISLISAVLQNFAEIPAVIHAMAGIRIVVSALVFSAVIKLIKGAVKSKTQLVIAIISFLLVAVFGTDPGLIVIGAALFGIFFMNIDGQFRLPNQPKDPEGKLAALDAAEKAEAVADTGAEAAGGAGEAVAPEAVPAGEAVPAADSSDEKEAGE